MPVVGNKEAEKTWSGSDPSGKTIMKQKLNHCFQTIVFDEVKQNPASRTEITYCGYHYLLRVKWFQSFYIIWKERYIRLGYLNRQHWYFKEISETGIIAQHLCVWTALTEALSLSPTFCASKLPAILAAGN